MFGEELMIKWANMFPYDRIYRKKYNIAFGSQEHRKINQIDVYLDALEDTLYDKHIKQHLDEKEALETYKKTGEWLRFRELPDKEFDKLFDSIKIEDWNKTQEVKPEEKQDG